MAKTVKPVQRQWARYDSIAEARRHSDIQARNAVLVASERSLNAWPVNPGGMSDPGRAHMQAQIMDQIAEKREQLRYIKALEGDELVMHYCAGDIAQVPAGGEVTINGEPLLRGGYVTPIAPGMPR